ncbi:MAG: phosphoribosyltransferase family protein [Patescibacteria group bacterium]
MKFKNRADAGQRLVKILERYRDSTHAIIIGLPRGGVIVAGEAAKELNLPLDIIVPRKIGAPGNPELAIGTVAEDGEPLLNEWLIEAYKIPRDYIDQTVARERQEAARRLKIYRASRPPLDLSGQTAILIDDGIAMGSTMRAAIHSARAKNAASIVVAVPVAAADSFALIKKEADEALALHIPEFFSAVGAFYDEFGETGDKEVVAAML